MNDTQQSNIKIGLTDEEAAFFNFSPTEPIPPAAVIENISKVRKTYTIPTDIVAQFDQYCALHQQKKTDVITQALREFLQKHT